MAEALKPEHGLGVKRFILVASPVSSLAHY